VDDPQRGRVFAALLSLAIGGAGVLRPPLYGAANATRSSLHCDIGRRVSSFRTATDFPIPDSVAERFYLAAGSEGEADAAMHRLSRKDDETGSNRWAATPLGAIVTAGFDEVANQLASYEMIMTEETEFSGPITANLKFSSSEMDSHMVARVGRVNRAGVYHALSLGTIRPALRKIDAERSTATKIAIDIDVPES
jgi:predicted acyl esterase